MWTLFPGSALRYPANVETSVLPSPVFISAILPSCKAIPPISCTSKWRSPMVRTLASRTAAKASGRRSSNSSPESKRSRNSTVRCASSSSLYACMRGSRSLIVSTTFWYFLRGLSSPTLKSLEKMPIISLSRITASLYHRHGLYSDFE